jgi:Flp pilus assembly protein TadD
VLAGTALFGILRQSFRGPVLRGRFGADGPLLALVAAVVWTLHPLQTEAVTYISQRAESLAALFYLLTLFAFIAGASSSVPARGYALSVVFCFLGVLTKEIIVTAPVIVLLYDRTFIAGTFAEAWRLRRPYYLGLASSWVLLAWQMAGLRTRQVGFGQGVAWWRYAEESCVSVALYLKLAVWPHPLVLDYGREPAMGTGQLAVSAAVVAVLLALTAVALWRRRAIGFVGAWFFLILAPTSSVVPIVLQPTAEHRAYLPLAAFAALGVTACYRVAGRWGLLLPAAAALVFGWLDVRRNGDYASDVSIWSDTAAKRPDNARAFSNLGNALWVQRGRVPEAIAAYRSAIRLEPGEPSYHSNLGFVLSHVTGHLSDGIDEYETALRIDPANAKVLDSYGIVLEGIPGRLPDAISRFEAALKIDPAYPEAHVNLGVAYANTPGRLQDAIDHFQAALRSDPDSAAAHNDLGVALEGIPGRLPEAISHFQEALRIRPDFGDARRNLDDALRRQ